MTDDKYYFWTIIDEKLIKRIGKNNSETVKKIFFFYLLQKSDLINFGDKKSHYPAIDLRVERFLFIFQFRR